MGKPTGCKFLTYLLQASYRILSLLLASGHPRLKPAHPEEVQLVALLDSQLSHLGEMLGSLLVTSEMEEVVGGLKQMCKPQAGVSQTFYERGDLLQDCKRSLDIPDLLVYVLLI